MPSVELRAELEARVAAKTQALQLLDEYLQILKEADIKPSVLSFEFFLLLRKEGLV